MEIFEVRYFLAVAELESVNQASMKLHVSPSALSKAISRLEEELHVELFSKEGRNIRLTEKGKIFLKKAYELLDVESDIKNSLAPKKANPEIVIAGQEIYLATYGIKFIQDWKLTFPEATFTFLQGNQKSAIESLIENHASVCITSNVLNKNPNLEYKLIDRSVHATYAGLNHPLALNKRGIHVNELLRYDCFTPSIENCFPTKNGSSFDGWRDDKFPRIIKYKNVGLKTMETLIESGMAIGYLPTFIGDYLKVKKLEVLGCTYQCEQKVYLVYNRSRMKWLFN